MFTSTVSLILMPSDMTWHKGIKNTGKDAEVYEPQSNPNGLIQCTVTREHHDER